MKRIVAINASPRVGWNTDILVREAVRGAESEGAEITVFDLYKLEHSQKKQEAFRPGAELNELISSNQDF